MTEYDENEGKPKLNDSHLAALETSEGQFGVPAVDDAPDVIRLYLLAASFTLWLAVAVAGPYALNGSNMAEVIVGIAVAIPFCVALATGLVGYALNLGSFLLCAALVVPASISCALGYVDVATILAIVILPFFVVTSAAMIAVPPGHLIIGLRAVAFVTLATLLLSTVSHGEVRFLIGKYAVWDRLTAGRQPNYLGLTALVGMIASLAWRGPVRLMLAAAFLWLTYLAQSRMTLSSMAICLLTISIQTLPSVISMARRHPKLSPAIISTFLIGIFGVGFLGVQKLLYLSSLGGRDISDMGGRTRIWKVALDVYSSAPFFGYGYRSQSTVNLLGEYYSHNMWLSALVEIGAVGTLTFLALYTIAFIFAVRHVHENAMMPICLTTLIVYLIYGVGEGRYINTGNPLSVIFLFTVVYVVSVDHMVRSRATMDKSPVLNSSGKDFSTWGA